MADKPGYHVCHEKKVTGEYQYSVAGPGLGYSKPWFKTEDEAECFARCCALAFQAGQRYRSDEIWQLLEDGRR